MSLLTHVGSSGVVPGAKGVFITRSLKKFTPIEVAPPRNAIAPPYMVNLLSTPQHTISLRRFLALRHQFSTGMYFNIATSCGWYLFAPSNYAPLADTAGLRAWRERHHHRYVQGTVRRRNKVNNGRALGSENAVVSSTVADPHCGGDLPSTALREGEQAVDNAAWKKRNEEDFTRTTDLGDSTHLASSLVIPEEHLFEINDGFFWELPPNDDLANAEYWRLHRRRLELYEDTSVTADQEEFFDLQQGTVDGLQERELRAQQRQLFSALTRKANVRLNVDDKTQLLTLLPIIDLNKGDELLLHYGREWWSQRLLSNLFMAVADDDISRVRWIEGLFAKPTDVSRPFPLLCPAVAQRKTRRSGKGEREREKNATPASEYDANELVPVPLLKGRAGSVVLCNMVTRRRATDAEALAFAVRKSCVDQQFFSALVGLRGTNVFDVSKCDDEVPLCSLRRVLLQSLRQGAKCTGFSALEQQEEEREQEEGDSESSSIVI